MARRQTDEETSDQPSSFVPKIEQIKFWAIATELFFYSLTYSLAVDSLCPSVPRSRDRRMDSGKWIRELREERSIKSGDIERISRSIADVKGSTDFYISHSTLCDIETGSVPSVHKLFSLAQCLTIALEELLLAFGIDVNELRRGNNSERGLGLGSEPEDHEPDRLVFNLDTGFENQETCLLRLSPTERMGIFPPQLHRYIDPKRHRYAVIGTADDTMYDLIPPRSLVEIDVMQNAVQMSGWASVLARPVYL